CRHRSRSTCSLTHPPGRWPRSGRRPASPRRWAPNSSRSTTWVRRPSRASGRNRSSTSCQWCATWTRSTPRAPASKRSATRGGGATDFPDDATARWTTRPPGVAASSCTATNTGRRRSNGTSPSATISDPTPSWPPPTTRRRPAAAPSIQWTRTRTPRARATGYAGSRPRPSDASRSRRGG
ncbi:MAG: hypothetical protein AVDCRST_MAG19-1048, partial [uncultured Thermomicrobiales bacterium]